MTGEKTSMDQAISGYQAGAGGWTHSLLRGDAGVHGWVKGYPEVESV